MDTNAGRSIFPAPHPSVAWMDGDFVNWEQCTLHVRTQAGFFGANIFEGLRAYWDEATQKSYIFRLDDHLKRLEQSMKIMRMKSRFDTPTLRRATIDLLSRCEFQAHAQINLSTYFRYSGPGEPLVATEDTGAHITAIPLPRSPKIEKGVAAAISTWRRISDDCIPPRAKVAANYQNSRLAQNEARFKQFLPARSRLSDEAAFAHTHTGRFLPGSRSQCASRPQILLVEHDDTMSAYSGDRAGRRPSADLHIRRTEQP